MEEKTYHIIYGVGVILTLFFSLLIILTGERSLNVTFLIFFWVVKLLSGFGLVLSVVNGFFFILNKQKEKLSEKATKAIIAFQIIVPALLIVYAVYKIYSSYVGGGGISMTGIWPEVMVWIDNIIYIYGIASLLLNLYILPLARQEFDKAINMGRHEKLGKNLKEVGRGLRKKWFSWRDQFAKAKVEDQKTIKEVLDNWRNRFAIILLVPLAIGAFIFMPITFVLVMMWLKIILFDRTTVYKYEKVSLLVSIIFVGVIAIIIPFFNLGIYQDISNWLWTINIFYLIGIVIATIIFVSKFLVLQGVTITGIKKARFDKKKETLEEEKKRLKQEKKEFEKLKKQTKKGKTPPDDSDKKKTEKKNKDSKKSK